MTDAEIVSLYLQRSEAALTETQQKYDGYLTQIAYNILSDREDAHESVNDTYWSAWNSIPPHQPQVLSAYLAKLTRRISIDRYRSRSRVKRGSGEYALSLEELEECLPAGDSTIGESDLRMLAQTINCYLRTLSPIPRCMFIRRYFHSDSLQTIAAQYRMSLPKTKSMLHRTRQGLKQYLKQEGYFHDQ